MDDRAELSLFLKSRRARLRPADLGLFEYGGRRRVAGLRREELALAAGVSTAHYTRLEQGLGETVSAEVVDAVGAALRLDADELEHLRRLAARPRACAGAGEPVIGEGMRHVLGTVGVPALLIGRHTQILARNPLAAAVFGEIGPTTTHELFTGRLRTTLRNWAEAAYAHVAHLRVLLGRYRGDAGLAGHVEEMLAEPEFARLWAKHPVALGRSRRYVLDHPAGELTLHGELSSLPDRPSCTGLELWAPEPGSPTAAVLAGLDR